MGRIGYELDEANTDKDVLTAKRGNNIHINYTGTNVNSPRDIISDVALATGVQRINPQFKERRQKTRQIMRQYGDEKDYSLGGHSLGGSIALDTLKQSKSIRDRTQVAHVFNPGYTKAFHESIKPTDKKVKRQLDTKVNIHRVKKDIVSAHANKETAFGNLFEYNSDKDADLLEKHSLDTFTNSDL